MQLSGASTTIRLGRGTDWPAVRALLEESVLPLAGLGESGVELWVADADGEVVGVAGLEVHGRYGLLRSLVVEAGHRGTGLGCRLTQAVLGAARDRGLASLFLLTTTAEGYFPRFGFRAVDRAGVPASLGASEELRGACPASAVVMERRLP